MLTLKKLLFRTLGTVFIQIVWKEKNIYHKILWYYLFTFLLVSYFMPALLIYSRIKTFTWNVLQFLIKKRRTNCKILNGILCVLLYIVKSTYMKCLERPCHKEKVLYTASIYIQYIHWTTNIWHMKVKSLEDLPRKNPRKIHLAPLSHTFWTGQWSPRGNPKRIREKYRTCRICTDHFRGRGGRFMWGHY